MSAITIQFVRGSGLASEAIEWKDFSGVSHVNIVCEDGQLLGALMNGGVQCRPANYDRWPLQILVSFMVSDAQYKAFWDYAKGKIGEKYDRLGIIGIALGAAGLKGNNEVFCSEFIAEALRVARILWIAAPSSTIDPEKLRLLVTAIPGAIEERIPS